MQISLQWLQVWVGLGVWKFHPACKNLAPSDPKGSSLGEIRKPGVTWSNLSLSFHFNGHFPGEPGLVGVY